MDDEGWREWIRRVEKKPFNFGTSYLDVCYDSDSNLAEQQHVSTGAKREVSHELGLESDAIPAF